LIKCDSKDFCINKIYLFQINSVEPFVHQRIFKHVSQFPQKNEAVQLFSTSIIIQTFFLAPNHHIRMISEGS